jgi:glucose 1-dehydrogenase
MPSIDLKGKVAIVTGGSGGIGAATVLAFAEAGANVVITYIANETGAKELVQQAEALGVKAMDIKTDVSNIVDLTTMVNTTVATFGRIDVLCNNAGIETRTSILNSTEAEYDTVMAVNLKSAFFATQLVAKQFIAQNAQNPGSKGGGVIINTSSVHEDWPMPGNTPYCLSKGGMRMLARTAGVELAEHNIRVMNLCPGAILTPINTKVMTEQNVEKLNAYIPLQRMGTPEEVAKVIVFLASDGASYMTASSVVVAGGIMQHSPGL